MAGKKRFISKNKRRRKAFAPERYNTRILHEEREYGFYWYEWLWKILRPVLIFMCSVLIVVGMVTYVWNHIYESYLMPMDEENSSYVEFVIESGDTVSEIANNLKEAGLLRNEKVFKYLVQFKGMTSSISYGTYALSPSMDAWEILDELTSGIQNTERTITITPGWTVIDIANYLYDNKIIASTDEFLDLCKDATPYINASYALSDANETNALDGCLYQLEGYLAPDTYRIFANATADDIIQTLLKQMNNVVDDVFYSFNEEYENAQYQSQLSISETIILASIIEKEGGSVEDYAKVSAILHNRLNSGMRLECDSTSAYLYNINSLVLSSEVLADNNAYNTYVVDGLPIGPICNPSKAAIEAALHPDEAFMNEGYLYFCTAEAGSGKLAYAKTYDEHQANVATYRASWEAYEEARANATEVPEE